MPERTVDDSRIATVELTDLEINEGSLVDKGDNPDAHITLVKTKPEERPNASWLRKAWASLFEKAMDEFPEEFPAAENPSADNHQPQDAKMPDTEKVNTEVLNADDGIQKQMNDVLKQVEAANKRAKAAEEALATMRDEKETAQYVSKARELDLPGVDVEELGSLLKSVEKAGDGLANKLIETFTALKAQSEKAEEILEDTVGADGSGESGATASEKLQKRADQLKTEKNLSDVDAYAAACEENPDLVLETF